MKIFTYTVTGPGVFPNHLLYEDECWPASDEDSRRIGWAKYREENVLEEQVKVKLKITLKSIKTPTVERWKFYDYDVSDVEVRNVEQ